MIFRIACCAFAALCTLTARAQWATQVISYQFGTNQTVGQDPQYFPANVLGPVTPTATPSVPANLPTDVVSLGRGGSIVVGFDGLILDGEGADFTVFENAFVTPFGYLFDEWLIVSVSMDGQTWHTFPYDTLTGAGMAGRTPTQEHADIHYLTPALSGGDAYDLAQLGLPQARYVRVQDATQYQSFDRLAAELDAVAVLHLSTATDEAAAHSAWRIACDGVAVRIVGAKAGEEFRVLNMLGNEVLQVDADALPLKALPAGCYWIQELLSGITQPFIITHH